MLPYRAHTFLGYVAPKLGGYLVVIGSDKHFPSNVVRHVNLSITFGIGDACYDRVCLVPGFGQNMSD